MAKIKLGLWGMPVIEKPPFTRTIANALTGNGTFPNPHPTPTELCAKADQLQQASVEAEAAWSRATELTNRRDQIARELDTMLNSVASYVETESQGNATKILSAGFAVRKEKTRVSELSVPANLLAEPGDRSGEMALKWERVPHAKTYVVEVCDNIAQPTWRHACVVTKTKASVGGLTSGHEYWFRVATVGTAGQSAWSDPATKFAP